MQIQNKIGIIDFGGQYAHLISSRVRRLGAYTEIISNEENISKYKEFSGIIFSGGPSSVYDLDSPNITNEIFDLNIPILGICYGHQLLMHKLGGTVQSSHNREYGKASIDIYKESSNELIIGMDKKEVVWMSHGDEVKKLPEGFYKFASTLDCEYAGVYHPQKKIYGIQFHPEVTHTQKGNQLLKNFVQICGLTGSWNMHKYLEEKLTEIKTLTKDKKIFMMISGGVDSTVSYILISKALGKEKVIGLLVDTGFMRKNEILDLQEKLKKLHINLTVYDASERYYKELDSVFDPEKKRKIIGQLFIDVRNDVSESMKLNSEEWILGQGTIYPDTIESGGTKHSHSIKTHHNRVDVILEMMKRGEIIEPIKELYKDEVRELGLLLGIDREFVMRHPFPGPGLAVRMINSYQESPIDKSSLLTDFLSSYKNVQYEILPVRTVGVQGDQRTYSNCLALNDFSSDWNDYNEVSTKLTNLNPNINRVVFMPNQKNKIQNWKYNPINLDKDHSDLLREADSIVNQIIYKYDLIEKIWQMPIALLPFGISENTYSIVLRPVESSEAMTANFYQMDKIILSEIVQNLTALSRISFVFYDITNKPPGTIEWE